MKRAAAGLGGGGVDASRGGNVDRAEAPANMASITPAAREPTRGGLLPSRQRSIQKSSVIIKDDPSASRDDIESPRVLDTIKPSHQSTRFPSSSGPDTTSDKFKGTGDSLLKASEATQGRVSEKPSIKVDKSKGPHDLGKSTEKMKSVQDTVYKHEPSKSKISHEPLAYAGYKVENIKYYGELKGYDYKSYGNIDKKPLGPVHEKCQPKPHQGYAKGGQPEKSVYSDVYYHRPSQVKPPNPYQVYQETKYSYKVSVTPGTPSQASAAAAFFAR